MYCTAVLEFCGGVGGGCVSTNVYTTHVFIVE